VARPSAQVRLFLLTAAGFTLAMILALVHVRTGAVRWHVAGVIALAWLLALSLSWMAIRKWCAALQAESAAPAGSAEAGQLQADLAQRDHMLREIHHRVKNNLQMISSLLSLQANRIRSPRIRRVFAGAQNRVVTMSILHRHLYERTNWSQVDFHAFLDDLVRYLSRERVSSGEPAVRFRIDAPVVAVGPDVAIPVGLIVTEAVTNALAHAFGGIANPEIAIRAHDGDGVFELSIEDNGAGIDTDSAQAEDQAGLGFTLLRGLSAQLGGTLSLSRRAEGGTRMLLTFPNGQERAADG
jgi:two-component sensor histidine kinase